MTTTPEQTAASERPSLLCLEQTPRCATCPCMWCGFGFDDNVEHAGKDYPAAAGSKPQEHYYAHPSKHMIRLFNRRVQAATKAALEKAAGIIEAAFSQHFSVIPEGEDKGKILQVREHPAWYVLPDPTSFEPHGARRIEMTGDGCPACMASTVAAEIRKMGERPTP